MDPRNPDPHPEATLPPLIAQLPPQVTLPYIPQSLITSGTRKDCIRLRNLPNGCQVTDILNFLAEFSQFIIYQGVHMVYSAQGEQSGEAFIQMDSEESAQLTSLNRHRRQMIFASKKRIIDVIQCSGEDMNLVLTNGIPTASLPPTIVPTMPTVTLAQPQFIQRPMFSHRATFIPTSTSLATALPLTHFSQHIPHAALPPTVTPITQIPPRPAAMFPQIIYWYPTPPVSPQTYFTPTNTGPSLVVMRGIPHNVTVQDILNFFQGFPEVTPEVIQFQQTADGRSTGEVLVTFSSRMEAERAVIERSRHLMGNRLIELFVA